MIIKIYDYTSDFAENKDQAKLIRTDFIVPALIEKKEVILDFKLVTSVTQSFIHALIREIIKDFGVDILDRLLFKNCNENIQKIISIVVEYIQDT